MFRVTKRGQRLRRQSFVEVLEQRRVLDARILITEFVADNESGLRDTDGDRSDWIEVRNVGDVDAQLEGWFLTDDAEDLSKWPFPAITLQPNQSQLVFASGKDRVSEDALHANFKLRRQGEYLALVQPDGVTVAHEFAPDFPSQHADVSFGLPQAALTETLTTHESQLRYFAPTDESGAELGDSWRQVGFNDTDWAAASGGLGYGSSLSDLFETDVRDLVRGETTSLYIRIPFSLDAAYQIETMSLHLNYDDGFAAYLNGHEVTRANVDGELSWDSVAAQSGRSSRVVKQMESFSFVTPRNVLRDGQNVLAFHVVNDALTSSDLLLRAELTAARPDAILSEVPAYFENPSPNVSNGIDSFRGKVEELDFSLERGFFDERQSVELTTSTVGASIVYTTDGSVPTADNGTVFSPADPNQPPVLQLDIAATTTLRAVGIKDEFISSSAATNTYVLIDDVIRQSPDGAAPAGWPDAAVNGQVFDFGMDPDVVNDPEYGALIKDSLLALPTFSIVTDQSNLTDPRTGIYVNGETARQQNDAWERPTSFELIYPDGTEGFQIDAGLRLRGGASRRDDNPKHSFRLLFRDEYGPTKLRYPLFGDAGVDEFDNIDLRTAQAPSWHWEGTASENTLLRDVFSRDTQRDMGNPHTRSGYYHLYLNGQYWGIYQTQERAEASFGEAYFGGDKDDYDVVKVEPFPHHVEATDGNDQAWSQLWDMAKAGFASDEAYWRVQGQNLDGSRNPEYPVLLDVNNLIDYMLVIFYTGDLDAPISNFGSNNIANNFYAMRDRTGDDGFQFFAHDAEWTLMNVTTNRLGPWPAGNTLNQANPQWLHQQLMQNEEYRLRFADRAQIHLFNDGALTVDAARNRVQARAEQLELAIIAESARWGDHRRPNRPYTKEDWERAVRQITESYIPRRIDELWAQLLDARLGTPTGPVASLVSRIDAPQFSHPGGIVPDGFELVIDSSHDVYFTTDGSDPRQSSLLFETTQLLSAAAPIRYYVPSDDSLGSDWTLPEFDDATWTAGVTGIGYGNFGDAVSTDIEADLKGVNTSLYARVPFEVEAIDVDLLELNLQFDDGVVVYLNGVEVARRNAPDGVTWDSVASESNRTSNQPVRINISNASDLLRPGNNLLAFHGLNRNNTSDFLLLPELEAARVLDLGLSPSARRYTGPIPIDANVAVKSRAFAGLWSALSASTFVSRPSPLRVSELMYHPAEPSTDERAAGFDDREDFEYIELINTSLTEVVDLKGVSLNEAMEFVFPEMELGPGQAIVVARNEAAFRQRYGDQPRLAGQYLTQQLSNSSELIRLTDAVGAIVQEFQYRDNWHPQTDGNGRSLVSVAAADQLFAWSLPTGWKPSLADDGTPGTPELLPGDSNRDGVFDSQDFVHVFRIGEYEDMLAENSSWDDGDWNGDGEFDSSDLVFAFANGVYVAE